MFTHQYAKPIVWVFSIISVLTASMVYNPHWAPTVAIVLFCSYNAYLELLVSLSFLSPGRPKLSFHSEQWISHDFIFDSRSVHTVSYWQEHQAPLLVLVHGWRASSLSVSDRGQWFVNQGWHVVLIELPSHGSSGWIPLWSAYKSIQAVEHVCGNLGSFANANMISSSFYYGHSMGGFVGLRLLSKTEAGVNGVPFVGLILESPMTMYSPILEEIALKLRVPNIIMGQYQRRLIHRFNTSISPRGDFSSMNEFDLPHWGTPSVPILCIQADPDERLGLDHYNRLLTAFKGQGQSDLLTTHRLHDLTHTGAKVHDGRNKLITEWLMRFK